MNVLREFIGWLLLLWLVAVLILATRPTPRDEPERIVPDAHLRLSVPLTNSILSGDLATPGLYAADHSSQGASKR